MQSSKDTNQQETEGKRFRNNIFFVSLDNIISALDTRFQTTAEIFEEFAAILKLKDLEEDSTSFPLISEQIYTGSHSRL